MNHADILEDFEAARTALPLQPGLPLATYPAADDFSLSLVLHFQRDEFLRTYGFLMPTAEVLSELTTLLAGKKVLEAGSGTGWLADQLARRGISIEAADWADYRLPRPEADCHGYPMRQVFRLDHYLDAATLLPGQYNAILLIWPNLASPLAANIARAMAPGQTLFFCGEGRGGCTADADFFDLLATDFELDEAASVAVNQGHWRFPGMHDRWWVGTKK
jgi:hypothetical protein